MKININKKQYWHLMRSMYMADWVANAICERDMEGDNGIKEARDYIFSFAKEFGYEDFVEYDADLAGYYATFDMDDESSTRKLIDKYDEHTTWEELSEWLGKRDFFKKYTEKEIKKMTRDDYFKKMMECQIVWEEEFEKNGINRLEILNKKAR